MSKGKPAKSAMFRERLKGRKTEGDFVRIAKFAARSPQFLALSPRASKVLLLLLIRYNGENNGDISIVRKELPALGFGTNGEAFAAGVDELVKAGFVIVTRPGGYRTGCTLYAVTTEPLDAAPGKHDFPSEHRPRHDWREKSPCTVSGQGQDRNPGLGPVQTTKPSPEYGLAAPLAEAILSPKSVHLYRSTKRSGLCEVASASADVSAVVLEVSSKGLGRERPERLNGQAAWRDHTVVGDTAPVPLAAKPPARF